MFKDEEGRYGPENDDIETRISSAKTLVDHLTPHIKTNPLIYLLPLKENMNARNATARTRRLVFGKFTIYILRS